MYLGNTDLHGSAKKKKLSSQITRQKLFWILTHTHTKNCPRLYLATRKKRQTMQYCGIKIYTFEREKKNSRFLGMNYCLLTFMQKQETIPKYEFQQKLLSFFGALFLNGRRFIHQAGFTKYVNPAYLVGGCSGKAIFLYTSIRQLSLSADVDIHCVCQDTSL